MAPPTHPTGPSTGGSADGAADGSADAPVDLLVIADRIVTMDSTRRLLHDAAVAVAGDRIVAVGDRAELESRHPDARRIGGPGHLAIPGLVNAHQHLTGDRLIRSTIPDDLPSGRAIFEWAVPIHAAHTGDDDELSATIALVEAVTNGITTTVEAGTVAHPDRVLAAFDTVGAGGTLGTWGWDVAGQPWAGTVDEVLDRFAEVMALTAGHPRVRGWATLVGHDLMTDELLVAASEFARQHQTGLTFHLAPTDSDPISYLGRTGVRPLVHFDRLGVLGRHVLLGHGVHLDAEELDLVVDRDLAIAYCPWAYLRLGQGVTVAGRHADLVERGARIALGCDSENAGDAVDVLRAASLAAGLAKDTRVDPTRFGAPHAFELATIGGARAIGLDHEIGSIEVGKRADVVLVDTTGPAWTPVSDDPVLQLVWNGDGRSVRHVVVAGRQVVADGRCTTVDLPSLAAEATLHRARLLRTIR